MAFRMVIIQNAASVSVSHSQLIVETEIRRSLPIEDISALLLENHESTISVAALSQLGQRGCAVFVCDDKHMPCQVSIPFNSNHESFGVFRAQADMTEPSKKRIWQAVVKQKIANQALCLEYTGYNAEAVRLRGMISSVLSGDTENVEAAAAHFYFPVLFGSGFVRGEDNGINAGLNYGYAILRGCIARYLAVYGLQPYLGIHHRSTQNPFNLADDIIEPFRPVIDLLVKGFMKEDSMLIPEVKRKLVGCLTMDILSNGLHYDVDHAIERMVQSYLAIIESRRKDLLLPSLLPTAVHSYA